MKKGLRIACKILSVFLSVLLVVQIAPMEVIANAYNEANVDENTLGVSLDDIDTTEPEAEIIAEETSKREENVKHFRMSDGSYRAAQYDVPVHFMLNGEWTDYDNTLTEVDADTEDGESASNKDLKNTLADYTVRLSKKTNGKKFVRIEKDGYKLSWYYTKADKVTAKITEIADDGDESTLEKLSSRVLYEDVYENIDFEYIVGSEGLKENIILKESGTQSEFESEYKANGLTPVQVDSHTINLVADDSSIVYVISAPYMIDSNGETSADVIITLSNVKNNKFTVTTTLDEEWLDDENRVYPVIVDPVIKTKQLYTEMDSTFVGTDYKDRCYYTYGNSHGGVDSGSLYVGNISGYGQTESYLKINTLPTLSVADKVVSAQLSIVLWDCDNGLQLDIKRLTEEWEMDSVTWNTKPSAESSIVDYAILTHDEEAKWLDFEITDLVRGWYSGDYPNYGISFSTTKTSSAKAWLFSSDFSEGGLTENRPILYVNYRNMSGYEDYWSYTGLSAGRNGAVSVNNYNGNLIFTQPLTQGDGGNLMPVAFSLIYNSNGKNAPYTYMAKNMQTNFHIYLRKETREEVDDDYRYYLNDADGTIHWFYFEEDNSTTGKDEDGLGYTLDIIAKGSDSLCAYTDGDDYAKFRITDKDKNKMYFNCAGNLIQITNANGVSATVQYETVENTLRMKSVTDGAGRAYTFGYNPYYPYLCMSITDPAGRKMSFEYGSGLMQWLTFPDGKTYTLYYTNNELTEIGSIDGTRTRISYDSTSQKRVTNINWGTSDSSLLESYSFVYKQNETTVTDIQNRSYTYQFNDFGQNTGIVSNTDGSAQYFEYNDGNNPSATANKLVSQSKVINTVTNYIVNPGFVRDYSKGYSTYAPDSTGSPTVSIDTSKGHLTKHSLKVYKPSTNTNNVTAVQKHSNLEAGTYTLSGYIDTAGATLTGKGAYFGVEFWNSSGQQYVQRMEEVKQTNGWQRVSLTFTIPEGYELRIILGFDSHGTNSYGTVWFDDLQLEKGTGMSSYNMLENPGMTNGKTKWSNAATLVSISDLPGFSQAITKTGTPTENWLGLSQFIYTQEGKQGDVFSIGAWIKADSAPINNLKNDYTYKPRFALALHFYDTSETCIGTEEVKLNDDLNTWQFVSGEVVAPLDYSYLCFEIIYYSNVNPVLTTGGFCFKEEFGQTYTYDKDGNISSVVDLSNANSTFAFQGNQMAKMLNPSGSEYLYRYDSNNNLTIANSTDGIQYKFTYDDKGNVTNSLTTEMKLATELSENVTYIIRNKYSANAMDIGGADSTVHNYRCGDVNENQKWTVEATGETDVYYLKCNGKYLYVESNSNTDNANLKLSTTLGSGNEYKFKILFNDNGTFSIFTKTSDYTKCVDGMPGSVNDCSDGTPIKQYTYTTVDSGQHWFFFIDNYGQNVDYISTSATYTDSKNFVASQTDQRGNTTNYNYNEAKGTLTSVTDAKNNTTSYVYDNNTNALQSVTSGGMTNSYSYTNDRLTDISVNSGTRYKFLYDAFGRTTATQVGNGTTYRNLSTLEYNSSGLLSKQTYGNADCIEFEYDNLDRLVKKTYNGSSIDKVQYFYGTDGKISQTIDFSTNSRTKYVYDLAGRLVSSREFDGANLTGINLKSFVNYTYADKTNYLTGVTHFSALGTQNIGYRYGDMSQGEMPDQIYGVTWNGNEKVSYTYDGLGRLTTKAINGVDTTYSYYDVAGVNNKTTTLLKSLTTNDITHNYEYDELGNITEIEFNGSIANSYEYDELNQLVRENIYEENVTYTYEYVNGNIKYKHRYVYTTGTLPATPRKTIEYHYEDSVWGDVLTKMSEITYSNTSTSTASAYSLERNSTNSLIQSILGDNYREVDLLSASLVKGRGTIEDGGGILSPESNSSTYAVTTNSTTLYTVQSDEIGNIVNVNGIDLNWNGRRLDSISQNGTDLISYKYNIDGQRISKTYDGVTTEYFYNGDILAGQKTGNDTIIFMYDNNGDVFGFTYNGTPYYYLKNAQNDVWAIADELGEAVVIYQYDAWGVVTACYDISEENIATINPITYRSYYMDLELGFFMYYLNSRYYMADWGRFLSADGIYDTDTGLLSHNMFAYCNNNPVNMIDSEGTGPLWNLIKNACKKIYKIVTGKEYEKQGVAKTTFDTSKTVVNAVDAYGEACSNARQDYITHVENVVNYNNNKGIELKALNNAKLNLNPESYYARRAYQGMYTYALGEGYNLKNMTWKDVQNYPELEKDLIGIYCIWDQDTVDSIATVYGVDWSVEQGSAIFFN